MYRSQARDPVPIVPSEMMASGNSSRPNSVKSTTESPTFVLSLPPQPTNAVDSAPLPYLPGSSQHRSTAQQQHPSAKIFGRTAPAQMPASSDSSAVAAIAAAVATPASSSRVQRIPKPPVSAGPAGAAYAAPQRPMSKKNRAYYKAPHPSFTPGDSDIGRQQQGYPMAPASERPSRTQPHAYPARRPQSERARKPHSTPNSARVSPARPSSGVLPAGQHAQHSKKSVSRGHKHCPTAPRAYVPVCAETAELLSDGMSAPGADAAAGFNKRNTAAHHSQHLTDCEVHTGNSSTQQETACRAGMLGPWVLQLVVIGFLIASFIVVPAQRNHVLEARREVPTDWIAGNLPGFLAAFLCPTFFALCFVWYAVQAYCSSAYELVKNVDRRVSLRDQLQHVRSSRPTVTFTATSYHYESKVRYERGEKQDYTLTVVTHEASKVFEFSEWQDATPELSRNNDVILTNLNMKKQLQLSDATRQRYFKEFNKFCKKNHFDVTQDYCRVMDVEGFKEDHTYLRDARQAPWWVSVAVYLVTVVLLVNVPFRMWIESNSRQVQLSIVKRIS